MRKVGDVDKMKGALKLAAWSWSAGLDGTSFGRFCRYFLKIRQNEESFGGDQCLI